MKDLNVNMQNELEPIRLTHTNQTHFQDAWDLYENTFPKEERRDLDFQNVIIKVPIIISIS